MQLLVTLTPEPQAVPVLCAQLRLSKTQLQQVVRDNYAGLVARGVQMHTATASEVGRSIKLPSLSNGIEPTYYSRMSRSSDEA